MEKDLTKREDPNKLRNPNQSQTRQTENGEGITTLGHEQKHRLERLGFCAGLPGRPLKRPSKEAAGSQSEGDLSRATAGVIEQEQESAPSEVASKGPNRLLSFLRTKLRSKLSEVKGLEVVKHIGVDPKPTRKGNSKD
jgi:hypothetical protein